MRRDAVPPVSCPREQRQAAFEVEYLTVEHAKIYDGQSRHWVVAWLWFLS